MHAFLSLSILFLTTLSLAEKTFIGSHAPETGLPSWFVPSNELTAWPSSNRAYLIPITLSQSVSVVKMAVNIGTATSGNIDVGIYDTLGNRILSSGSTAMGSANQLQVIDTPDVTLAAGDYFLALAVDNAVGHVVGSVTPPSGNVDAAGVHIANSAFPLPATVTPASSGTTTYSPAIWCSQLDNYS